MNAPLLPQSQEAHGFLCSFPLLKDICLSIFIFLKLERHFLSASSLSKYLQLDIAGSFQSQEPGSQPGSPM